MVLQCRLLRRDQPTGGRDNPTATPEHDRINPPHPRDSVSTRRPPDAAGTFQDGRPTIDLTNGPPLNGRRPGVGRWCERRQGPLIPLRGGRAW